MNNDGCREALRLLVHDLHLRRRSTVEQMQNYDSPTASKPAVAGQKMPPTPDSEGTAQLRSQVLSDLSTVTGPADDAELHVYYGNRCACYQQLRRWREALEDAEAATSIKPGWAKGWARLGV